MTFSRMNQLDKSIDLINLYDIYQDLLTDKQREYFELYYYEDYSLQEISENLGVSRNAAHDQIKRTEKKLHDFESRLHLKSQEIQRNKIITQIKQSTTDETVLKWIDELEKVE